MTSCMVNNVRKIVAMLLFISFLLVLHVYGTPYAMGYAHGQLLQSQIQKMLPAFMKHVESEVDQYVKFLPEDVRGVIEQLGLDAVLDMTHLLTE